MILSLFFRARDITTILWLSRKVICYSERLFSNHGKQEYPPSNSYSKEASCANILTPSLIFPIVSVTALQIQNSYIYLHIIYCYIKSKCTKYENNVFFSMPGIASTITKGNKPFIRVRLPVPSFSPVIAKY